MIKKNINLTTVFSRQLRKKIDKTVEARSGKGIYKRRNNRNYRVVMHYSTYKRIITENADFLNKYENGYAVRISPEEYFKDGEKLADGLELGKNAFIYYKSIYSFNQYPPKDEWNEIVELYTSNQSKLSSTVQEWAGEYALFINNARPAKISTICKSNNILPKDVAEEIKQRFGIEKVASQAGLGNFDYDYATKGETLNIKYQLSFLMLNVKGMDEYLYDLCKNDVLEREYEFSPEAYIAAGTSKEAFFEIYKEVLELIGNYCVENELLDFEKLEEIRAWDNSIREPVCPLCLESLSAEDFLEVELQANGREEEDNTRSKIALMHIHALKPGEINHRTYNLGWGHRHCNQIQEDQDIETTIQRLRQIVKQNEGKVPEKNSLPVEESTPLSPK